MSHLISFSFLGIPYSSAIVRRYRRQSCHNSYKQSSGQYSPHFPSVPVHGYNKFSYGDPNYSSMASPDSETIPNTLVLVIHGTSSDPRRLEEMKISQRLPFHIQTIHPGLNPLLISLTLILKSMPN